MVITREDPGLPGCDPVIGLLTVPSRRSARQSGTVDNHQRAYSAHGGSQAALIAD